MTVRTEGSQRIDPETMGRHREYLGHYGRVPFGLLRTLTIGLHGIELVLERRVVIL